MPYRDPTEEEIRSGDSYRGEKIEQYIEEGVLLQIKCHTNQPVVADEIAKIVGVNLGNTMMADHQTIEQLTLGNRRDGENLCRQIEAELEFLDCKCRVKEVKEIVTE